MTATIHHGDCLDVLRSMPDNSVDAVVCDPPYGLSNTSPDKVTETIVRWAQGDREYVPTGKGFMGASWDAFVPPVAVWDECLRVLKPGGHLVAFAGSRTQDLMGLAIRLAGFDIRENLAWLYGSGFPKSMDVSKQIDKAAGADREVIGQKITGNAKQKTSRTGEFVDGKHGGQQLVDVTAPATPEAEKWSGWGTALKPAHEPIILARKPIQGTVASNTLTWGTGGLNIDATRIGTQPAGRWPANVVLDPDTAKALDQQSGNCGGNSVGKLENYKTPGESSHVPNDLPFAYGDKGGASRFFKVVEPDPPFMYAAKAPKRERPRYEDADGNVIQHPTTKPLSIMKWLVRLTCPPGGTILDPFAGSGATIEAAMLEGFNVIGIEREAEYLPLIQQRIDRATNVLPMAS